MSAVICYASVCFAHSMEMLPKPISRKQTLYNKLAGLLSFCSWLGEDAVCKEKQVPKTIENQRVADETMVQDDEEVSDAIHSQFLFSYYNSWVKNIIDTADWRFIWHSQNKYSLKVVVNVARKWKLIVAPPM